MVKSSRQLQQIRALGLPMTDIVHERIHHGEFFSAFTYEAALADDGFSSILIQCAETMSCHFSYIVRAGGDAEIQLYEAPTFSNAGSSLTVVDRNRITNNSPLTTLTTGPTVSDTGTLLESQFIPGGTTGFLSFNPGGEGSMFKEYVFAPGTDYLLYAYNRAGGAQPMNIQVDFYEPISGVA